jgi:hypothetical protein
MALTAQQIADVRRYAGYPALGIDTVATDDQDVAYSGNLPGVWWQTMFHRLKNLTPENETTLVNVYLTNLATLETAIVSSSENLDTDSAAVWKHNKNEVGDRSRLFDGWRRRMCGFLGVAPGPDLGCGNMIRLVRA